jgi:RNA 3'-terminal phosphate cyclase (ATP)
MSSDGTTEHPNMQSTLSQVTRARTPKQQAAVDIDGSLGEGGGQVLRSSLSLAMLSGRSLRLRNIRAGRSKPGLMRQHLTCVLAAARVCAARVEGAEIGSTQLEFEPGPIQAGHYAFAIGSAGSTALVLQTLLPALLVAGGPSRVRIEGGTHVPMAPCADFIARAYLPVLRSLGAQVEFRLLRHGFVPAGGGAIEVEIQPQPLRPLQLDRRGDLLALEAEAMVSQLPQRIVERELDTLQRLLPQARLKRREPGPGDGPGNALLLHAQFEGASELITVLGRVGLSSESVAKQAAGAFKRHLAHGAPVGEHLADQLLLPMLIAGGGHFVTGRPSSHLQTNIETLRAFDLAEIELGPDESDPPRRWRLSLRPRAGAICI